MSLIAGSRLEVDARWRRRRRRCSPSDLHPNGIVLDARGVTSHRLLSRASQHGAVCDIELAAVAGTGDDGSFKVALGRFGAPRIAQLAQQLEGIFPSPGPATINDLVTRFQAEAQQLMKALQQFCA